MTVIWTPRLDENAARWQQLAHQLGRERFAPLAPELDRDQRYPWETVQALVEHRFTGLFLPQQWGGEGASLESTVAAVEALGTHCASTAAIMCAYQLGAFPLLPLEFRGVDRLRHVSTGITAPASLELLPKSLFGLRWEVGRQGEG